LGNLQDLEIMQACVARFVRERAGTEAMLGPFSRYLRRRHVRVLRSALNHADDVFEFWDWPESEQNCNGGLARTAA
jgi:hypothetical protein